MRLKCAVCGVPLPKGHDSTVCNSCAIDALETDGFGEDDELLTELLEDLDDDDDDDPLNLPPRRKQ